MIYLLKHITRCFHSFQQAYFKDGIFKQLLLEVILWIDIFTGFLHWTFEFGRWVLSACFENKKKTKTNRKKQKTKTIVPWTKVCETWIIIRYIQRKWLVYLDVEWFTKIRHQICSRSMCSGSFYVNALGLVNAISLECYGYKRILLSK